MSERVEVEPGTDLTSEPLKHSCCGIADCGGRFHGRIEHWTDRRLNVRPKHNTEPDHSTDSGHDAAWNDESEQHNSGDSGTDA